MLSNQLSPTIRKQPTLRQLLRRMIFSFILSLIGSWGLIIPRLHILNIDRSNQATSIWFYTDVTSLALAIFGVFMIIYLNSRFIPRLERLNTLGEAQW